MLMSLCQSAPTVFRTCPCSPVDLVAMRCVCVRISISVMATFIIAMMAAMKFPLCVTTAIGQASPCAGTAAVALRLRVFAEDILCVVTALTSPILGQIAQSAQRRASCPAQVFLGTVQSFVMVMQLVQMLGMNYSLPVKPDNS